MNMKRNIFCTYIKIKHIVSKEVPHPKGLDKYFKNPKCLYGVIVLCLKMTLFSKYLRVRELKLPERLIYGSRKIYLHSRILPI